MEEEGGRWGKKVDGEKRGKMCDTNSYGEGEGGVGSRNWENVEGEREETEVEAKKWRGVERRGMNLKWSEGGGDGTQRWRKVAVVVQCGRARQDREEKEWRWRWCGGRTRIACSPPQSI